MELNLGSGRGILLSTREGVGNGCERSRREFRKRKALQLVSSRFHLAMGRTARRSLDRGERDARRGWRRCCSRVRPRSLLAVVSVGSWLVGRLRQRFRCVRTMRCGTEHGHWP
jgi:hypothetical protein